VLASAFRELYYTLMDAESDGGYVARLLAETAASAQVRETMRHLGSYAQPGSHPAHSDAELQASWALYALSRVSDYLLPSFQGRPGEPAPFPSISAAEYTGFFRALGFEVLGELPYSPFFHEIVEVSEDSGMRQGVQIEHQFWPGLTFGKLLFARAGVRIRCQPSIARKEYAETTLLCFSYRRHHRRAADRSLGWGSNSQWRTAFRRDYVDGDLFRFNVDGEVDIGGAEPRVISGMDDFDAELPIALRRELLVNRCFVSRAYPWSNDEDWPSRDTLTVRRDDPLVPH
jgi:hypothetical protein